MTPVYFKCEFIRAFAYSKIDSNCIYFSGVEFGVARLQGTDGSRHWLWVGIFIHQILLKYYFSEEVASFQVTVPFDVMLFFLGEKTSPAFDVSRFLKMMRLG